MPIEGYHQNIVVKNLEAVTNLDSILKILVSTTYLNVEYNGEGVS